MFIAAQFVTAPSWELPKMPINSRIYKLWCILTTEYHSAVRMNDLRLHLKLSVNLTSIKLNEISRTQKRACYMFLFIPISSTGTSTSMVIIVRMWLP